MRSQSSSCGGALIRKHGNHGIYTALALTHLFLALTRVRHRNRRTGPLPSPPSCSLVAHFPDLNLSRVNPALKPDTGSRILKEKRVGLVWTNLDTAWCCVHIHCKCQTEACFSSSWRFGGGSTLEEGRTWPVSWKEARRGRFWTTLLH